MNIAVWDTYVQRREGPLMHFDILVPAEETAETQVHRFGNAYLAQKGITGVLLSATECRFCHIEEGTEAQVASIKAFGYAIIEMEHCN